MNADDRYEKSYAILGLRPPCSWEDVRLAYRRRVRQCHPDLVSPATAHLSTEGNREFRHVVRAYHELAAYHRTHGQLPPPTRATRSLLAHARSGRAHRFRPGADFFRRVVPRFHQAAFALFVAGVTTAAAVNEMVQVEPSADARSSSGRIDLGMQPTDVVDVQGIPHYTKGSVWFYGESGVVFDGNCVIGWENQPPFPLRTLVNRMHYGSRRDVDDCR